MPYIRIFLCLLGCLCAYAGAAQVGESKVWEDAGPPVLSVSPTDESGQSQIRLTLPDGAVVYSGPAILSPAPARPAGPAARPPSPRPDYVRADLLRFDYDPDLTVKLGFAFVVFVFVGLFGAIRTKPK